MKFNLSFFNPNRTVELFDTDSDPWHITNIANKPEYQKIITQLSDELDRWMIETRDIGLIPEPMFHELCWRRKKYRTIYEYAQSDEYPVEKF
jgi:N-sulfoglucosamine sulfohydrolase